MKIYPIIIAFISACLFGIATPVSKALLNSLNPFQLAGLLYLGAGIGLIPYQYNYFKGKQYVGINKENIKKIIGAIICGGILGPVFLLFGLSHASSSSVSIWLNLELFATAVLGHFFFHDYLGKNGWFGVVLGFLAGVFLSFNDNASGFLAGSLITAACLCWGMDNHFTAMIDGISPAQSTMIKGIVAGFVNCIIGYIVGGCFPPLQAIIIALVVGVFSYGVSIVLYITSAQNIGAVRSQIIFSSAPFWGLIFSIILLHDSISIIQIAAIMLLIISIFLVMSESHNHPHEHSSCNHIHLHRHDDEHHMHTHSGQKQPLMHIHFHNHTPISHVHKHLPDIHHRHDHAKAP